MTRIGIVCLAVIGSLLVVVPAVGAAPAPRGGTSISTDGKVTEVENAAATRSVSPSFSGTGVSAASSFDGLEVDTTPRTLGRESVIGADGRVQVNPTTSYPSRANGLITFTQSGSSYICTGWMISRNTVATAGHCVAKGNSTWYPISSYRFYPGKNGSSNPYGSCTVTRMWTNTTWFTTGNQNYDYAALRLNCSIGNTTGWYGFSWQSTSLNGTAIRIQGYPGDKPYGTQWGMSGTVASSNTNKVYYTIDTAGGQSGSAVYANKGGSCTVCGIAFHAYGGSTQNSGTRITQTVFNQMVSWINS